MTLARPVLDNRTFDQLVSESVGQIARLAPTWTDYNASDPGITLVELMAWLSEQSMYRTSRITPELSRAFLRLVGITSHPAGVASAVILLTNASAAAIALPDRVQVTDPLGTVTFETREKVSVSPANLVQVLAGAAGALRDVTADNIQAFDASADPTIGTFQSFGGAPKSGTALYLGFDRALGNPGDPISLHLWTRTPEADAATVQVLQRNWEIDLKAAERDCPPDIVSLLPDWRRHYAARVVWEFYAGNDSWEPLPSVDDETRALTLTGFVRFVVPVGHVSGGPGPHWFVRCRLVCGGFECAPWLDRVAINAVTAEHSVSVDAPEQLGVSLGHATETYSTSLSPVVVGTTRLTLVSGAQRDDGWTECIQWDLVGPHDRHYLLDPDRGRISSGNGMRGVVFPDRWHVVLNYRVGGGTDGNIPAQQLTTLATSGWNNARVPGLAAIAAQLTVILPYAAMGGAPPETLAATEARAVADLALATKTVTLADFATLALATPGVPVARAKAIANHYPALPCFTAPGSITLIVVPNCPGTAPLPSPGFLAAVKRYLHPRRPVTTELHVIAPTYLQVTVSAQLLASSGSDPSVLTAIAQQKLDTFFNPLAGGPDGTGWPIGRWVYRVEVMTLLASIGGVLAVSELTLAGTDGTPTCDNLDLCPHSLVQSMQHQITVSIAGTTTFSRSKERVCS
jgi:hypothetical protein